MSILPVVRRAARQERMYLVIAGGETSVTRPTQHEANRQGFETNLMNDPAFAHSAALDYVERLGVLTVWAELVIRFA
jgi:hypothetical protein